MSDSEKQLQEARLEITKLRHLILEQTSITCRGQKYWPEWVNKYFESIDSLPSEGGGE